METDEQQIRELVVNWIAATRCGDIDTLLGLTTDDVVFLTPGRPAMRKSDFAAAARAQGSGKLPRLDGKIDIQEIQVHDDWAFMWSRLTVVATAPDGSAAKTRSGHTLTVLRRERGRWLLARDANLMVAQTP